MNTLIVKFLTSYMIMPLLAVIFTFIAYLISKKNKLFSNKKAILYVLLFGLLLSIPGLLGFLDYGFMPYCYIILVVIYLTVGGFSIGWMKSLIPNMVQKDVPYIVEFSVHFIIMLIGAAFFSLFFNIFNELQYGLWACTCVLPYIFPSLFYKTYLKYMEIPLEIHKVWRFSHNEDLSDFDRMDYNRLMVLELEFCRKRDDNAPIKVKAKAPDNMPFGTWFRKFIADYNVKFPSTPVELMDGKEYYGWIFYVKRSFFMPRRYVDFELTVPENKIREKHTVIAKRVLEEENINSNKIED